MNYKCPLCKKDVARESSTYPGCVVCKCSGQLVDVGVVKNKVFIPHSFASRTSKKLFLYKVRAHQVILNLMRKDDTIMDYKEWKVVIDRVAAGAKMFILTTQQKIDSIDLDELAPKLLNFVEIDGSCVTQWGRPSIQVSHQELKKLEQSVR